MIRKISYKYLSIGFYIISLITPSFFGSGALGVHGLILGGMGIFFGALFIAIPWMANLFYIGNLIFNKVNLNFKIILSIITIVSALFVIGLQEIPETESHNVKIIPGIGFIFWILSFILLLIGQLNLKRINKSNELIN